MAATRSRKRPNAKGVRKTLFGVKRGVDSRKKLFTKAVCSFAVLHLVELRIDASRSNARLL